MIASVIAAPRRVMRWANQSGTRPPCSGRSATPERFMCGIISQVRASLVRGYHVSLLFESPGSLGAHFLGRGLGHLQMFLKRRQRPGREGLDIGIVAFLRLSLELFHVFFVIIDHCRHVLLVEFGAG